MTKDFSDRQIKVVYTADALEFHAAEESQVHDEDLIWSLYHPMLDLFMITNPATKPVPRKLDYDDDFVAEMKSVFTPDAMKYVEFFQGLEKIELEQNPTRDATMFPVKLIFLDDEGMTAGPEGHAGLKFLKDRLNGRENITVGNLKAIADEWRAR